MPFVITHNMPGPFNKFWTNVCLVMGVGDNSKVHDANKIFAAPLPQQLQQQSQQQAIPNTESAMDPDVQQVMVDILNITNPGVKDPRKVRIHDLPNLRVKIENCKPKGMDEEIADISRNIVNAKEADTPANSYFHHITRQVYKKVRNPSHIWFAIRYLFTVLDKVEFLLQNDSKKTTALPYYADYLRIVLCWACRTYMQNPNDSVFLKKFIYAMSHGNAILSKRDGNKNSAEKDKDVQESSTKKNKQNSGKNEQGTTKKRKKTVNRDFAESVDIDFIAS